MKVAVEAVEGCKRRLAVEAPADVVQQEWERAYGRVQKQARLPGFRKGHVPRSLVKRSEEHTSELQSRLHLVCRLLLEKKKKKNERVQSRTYKLVITQQSDNYI